MQYIHDYYFFCLRETYELGVQYFLISITIVRAFCGGWVLEERGASFPPSKRRLRVAVCVVVTGQSSGARASEIDPVHTEVRRAQRGDIQQNLH